MSSLPELDWSIALGYLFAYVCSPLGYLWSGASIRFLFVACASSSDGPVDPSHRSACHHQGVDGAWSAVKAAIASRSLGVALIGPLSCVRWHTKPTSSTHGDRVRLWRLASEQRPTHVVSGTGTFSYRKRTFPRQRGRRIRVIGACAAFSPAARGGYGQNDPLWRQLGRLPALQGGNSY